MAEFYVEYDPVEEEWNVYEVDGITSDGIVHDNFIASCFSEKDAEKVAAALRCRESIKPFARGYEMFKAWRNKQKQLDAME